ncbi:MAG: 4-hydroxy-3-methylbut-2-enyl diphosphate reductase [Sedimentisphaerales bacterium]|nr:4-hydroxy-3-methylbut-2-enyl diphosphate reductase [Sedimentisphaerales bacterium]
MEVLVADKCGFCFGVELAIERAEKMLQEGKTVYCLGDLIHNKVVVQRLTQDGLRVVNSLEEIPAPAGGSNASEPVPTVLIRSHGCRPELIEAIGRRGLHLADATCVLVKRAQKLVRKLHQEGYRVIVIGDPDHPEVQGLVGYAPDVRVVARQSDLENLPEASRWAVISQTTHSSEDFARLVGLIAERDFQELKVVNTICRETTRRQKSAVALCRQVQVMFVIGSHRSANTRELAQICRRQGVQTYHLQSWQEFLPRFVEGKSIAGVTAGASTPSSIIQEFVDNLRRI